MIALGREIRDYAVARSKEFLLTANGDYCSQSLAGNTRKYHGLLVHQGRVLFSTCDEYLNGERISVASYEGAVLDGGLRWLYGFSLYPPRWYYAREGAILCKTLEFDGELRIRYTLWGEGTLRVIPLMADREIHGLQGSMSAAGQPTGSGVQMKHLVLTGDGCRFTSRPDWYHNIWYEEDAARGYPCKEDLPTPGFFEVNGRDWNVVLCAQVPGSTHVPSRSAHISPSDPISCLRTASSDFLVGERIVAGYHWFPEAWGRDTFVSLPGLLLDRCRFREAEAVFRYFARRMKNGIIPNRVPDSFRSSDASLWFIWALSRYKMEGGREEFLVEMNPWVEEIMSKYGESGIAIQERELIRVAPQSTWMDTVYTPREGKPVEVNALWIHALSYASDSDLDPAVSPERALQAFQKFWNEEKGYFFDRLDPLDSALRPNQLLALSLGLASPDQGRRVLDVVQKHLLTPFGIRTLASNESGYRGKYAGDAGYHNGSAWPWLMGPYVEAVLRNGGNPDRLMDILQPLFVHLNDAGLGTISEYFDGDPPHTPRGCIAQAWSVAELLRSCHLIRQALEKSPASQGFQDIA